jgi:amino acid transporter
MPESAVRKPRWYLIPVRVLPVTFVMTLLSFAVSLLLGILGVALAAKLRGVRLNMTISYRQVAIPAAAMVGAIIAVSAIFMEVRHYRQARALERIENHMHPMR